MSFEFEIFADYHQIIVNGSDTKDLSDYVVSDGDIKERLYTDKDLLVVQTCRDMETRIRFDVYDVKPEVDTSSWDHIIQCGFEVTSGSISVFGPTDFIDDYHKIPMESGFYGVYVCYSGLNTISKDGLDGNDYYQILLWKESSFLKKKVLKQFN